VTSRNIAEDGNNS